MIRSNPLRRVFSVPNYFLRILRKTQIDNFLGGLLIGSIFSLLVNVITVSFQEMVARQQYFESLEHEIVDNYLEADNTVKLIEGNIKENRTPSTFIFTKRYQTNIWESGNALTYIYSIDPKIQFKLADYYHTGINRTNRFLDRLEDDVYTLEDDYLKCTYTAEFKSDCDNAHRALTQSILANEKEQLSEARYVLNQSNEILDIFHPTKDRVKDPVLKFLMGNKAANIFILDPIKTSPTPTPKTK